MNPANKSWLKLRRSFLHFLAASCHSSSEPSSLACPTISPIAIGWAPIEAACGIMVSVFAILAAMSELPTDYANHPVPAGDANAGSASGVMALASFFRCGLALSD